MDKTFVGRGRPLSPFQGSPGICGAVVQGLAPLAKHTGPSGAYSTRRTPARASCCRASGSFQNHNDTKNTTNRKRDDEKRKACAFACPILFFLCVLCGFLLSGLKGLLSSSVVSVVSSWFTSCTNDLGTEARDGREDPPLPRRWLGAIWLCQCFLPALGLQFIPASRVESRVGSAVSSGNEAATPEPLWSVEIMGRKRFLTPFQPPWVANGS